MPWAVKIAGKLNTSVLEKALAEIVQRHEIFRTSFKQVHGTPVQAIDPLATLTVRVVDLRDIPEAEQSSQVKILAKKEAQQPFDISKGPLMRATLWQLGEMSHVLLITWHHIICDGWSLRQQGL